MALIFTTAGTTTSTVTSTGDVAAVPARILTMYAVCAGTAGSIVLKNSSGGSTLATIATPASATATINVDFGAEGLNFTTNPHATLSNVTSVMFVYG